ncbi:hypothetical protein HA402_014673 [Bradysia odoriphaga]|nr:hypothetical protein HA402_014673 [Bradysia odoriphaga]
MSATKIAQKLFVRNLPWTVSSVQLKEYFSGFGHVSSASVAWDKQTGMNRGYGFVSFSLNEVRDTVLQQKVHTLHGRAITLEPSNEP